MALLFMDSLEFYSTIPDMETRWYDLDLANSGGHISFGTEGRNGTRSLATVSFAGKAVFGIGDHNTNDVICLAFDFKIASPTIPAIEGGQGIAWMASFFPVRGANQTTTDTARLSLNADGSISAWAQAANEGTTVPGVIVPNTLHRIEWRLQKKNNNTGICQIYVDGVLVLNLADFDSGSGGEDEETRCIIFTAPSPSAEGVLTHFANIICWNERAGIGPGAGDFPLGNLIIEGHASTDADLTPPYVADDPTFKSIDAAGPNLYPIEDDAGGLTYLAAQAHIGVRTTGETARFCDLIVTDGVTSVTQPALASSSPAFVIKTVPVDIPDSATLNATQVGVELTDL